MGALVDLAILFEGVVVADEPLGAIVCLRGSAAVAINTGPSSCIVARTHYLLVSGQGRAMNLHACRTLGYVLVVDLVQPEDFAG